MRSSAESDANLDGLDKMLGEGWRVVSNAPMGGVGGIAATGQGAETLHTRAEWASLLILEREE